MIRFAKINVSHFITCLVTTWDEMRVLITLTNNKTPFKVTCTENPIALKRDLKNDDLGFKYLETYGWLFLFLFFFFYYK